MSAVHLADDASTTVYVGDTPLATYTVDRPVVPIGTQTVQGRLSVNGLDAISGSITDPLAPIIKDAVQHAVTFNDQAASDWQRNNGCLGCHIQTQAMAGGELNRRFSLTVNETQRTAIINGLTRNQSLDDGHFNNGLNRAYKSTGTLAAWALATYRKQNSIASVIRRAADYMVTQQDVAGTWTSDFADRKTWWDNTPAMTALNLKNLVDATRAVTAAGQQAARTFGTHRLAYADANGRGTVAFTPRGTFIGARTNGTVAELGNDNAMLRLWSGLDDPRALVAAGNRILDRRLCDDLSVPRAPSDPDRNRDLGAVRPLDRSHPGICGHHLAWPGGVLRVRRLCGGAAG